MNECAKCGRRLETDEQFCSACGTPVARDDAARCPSCGRELKPWARFCGGCGSPVVQPGEARAPAGRETVEARAPAGRETVDGVLLAPSIPLAAGIVIVLLGSVLPWARLLHVRGSAWDLSVSGLLGLPWPRLAVGTLLLVTVIPLVFPPARRRGIVLALGGLAVVLAGLALVRAYTANPPLSPQLGLVVTAIGGVAMMVVSRTGRAARRRAPATPAPPAVAEPIPSADMEPDDLEYVRPLGHSERARTAEDTGEPAEVTAGEPPEVSAGDPPEVTAGGTAEEVAAVAVPSPEYSAPITEEEPAPAPDDTDPGEPSAAFAATAESAHPTSDQTSTTSGSGWSMPQRSESRRCRECGQESSGAFCPACGARLG